MSIVIDHLEYLLQRHDCVTVPRLGAMMVRYRPARFERADSDILLPPARELAFNGAMTESDGLLEASVARQYGISFEAARRMVEEEISGLLHHLRHLGELHLGRLGQLQTTDYGSFVFTPGNTADWDYRFFGMRPLRLRRIESAKVTSPVPPYVPEEEEIANRNASSRGTVARGLIGIAATLAVIVTLALFLLNPIRVNDAPRAASIAPTHIAAPEPATPVVEDETLSANPELASDAKTEDLAEPVAKNATAKVSVRPDTKSAPEAVAPQSPLSARTDRKPSAQTPATAKSPRFNTTDPFCVIVASFPDEAQANRYLSENHGRHLGVLKQDGKFRIYAATGTTYEQASSQKALAGGGDAWICRR